MKTFVLGDVHGSFLALEQVLQKSGFNYLEDQLIFLGDVADGWSQVYESVNELLKIKNLVSIKGNHDDWWLTYLETGNHPTNFTQGGKATLESYTTKDINPRIHYAFFKSQKPYFVDDNGNVFVHGGFNRHFPLDSQPIKDIYWWDRDLLLQAMSVKNISDTRYNTLRLKDKWIKKIFIGHTTTTLWSRYENNKKVPNDKPIFCDVVVDLDTGAGFDGKLTLMNVDTLEYWQSDPVKNLYADEMGRN